MTDPNKNRKVSLDVLISATLRSSVADAEPSPQVWERIEHQVRQANQAARESHTHEVDLRPRYARS
jgi:anti-sigma-K factor RskA